ncbi:general secretion pathway protein C [mine drainage metagenome]|uniref:General secretion pathway protein C n=2 Tax=mine drainage metagenome TaxID=410659 RepID=T1A1P8_9ZZZZ
MGLALWLRAPVWLPFLLVIALGWTGAHLTWSLWGRPTFHNPPPMARPLSKTPEIIFVHAITEHPLFGQPSKGAGSSIATTRLALTLLGVAATRDKKDSWAIIALGGAGAPERVFTIGSLIPGGAKILSIHPKEVILTLAGELQALKLNTGSSGIEAPAQPGGGMGPNLPQMLARQPMSLLKYIRPMPVFKSGHFAGYRVFPGARPRAFLRLGLAPGDIIQAINGITLTNPVQSLNLIHRLAQSHQPITLMVQDNGQVREITIPPSQP